MGVIGQQDHPEVVAAVEKSIAAGQKAGKYVGVNAFAEGTAKHYIELGAHYVGVGADVALLARGTEALAAKFRPGAENQAGTPASY